MQIFTRILLLMTILLLVSCQETYQMSEGKIDLSRQKMLYYGVKINAVLCGYAEVELEMVRREGQKYLRIDDRTFVKVSALGSKFNSEIHSIFYVDSMSGRFQYQENFIKQGPMNFHAEAAVKGDTIILTSTLSEQTGKILIGPDVILRNNQFFPYLIEDFVENELQEKTYRYFEIKDQEIQETTFHCRGQETLQLAGAEFDALVLEEMNQKTGVKMKWWLDKKSGYLLKLVTPRGETFLAEADVKEKITLSEMDDLIMLKTNLSIADFQAISYMKVRARLEPSGLRLNPGSLNVPGQKFKGTVTDNLIDGIFEIEHKRYDGNSAPPFPPNLSQVDSLQEFLDATDIVESDDSLLQTKAQWLTEGAKTSWEAAVLLSQWVADSIGYAIPGGATARQTYDIRKGECGAHSNLLVAFCRAVKIPSRMVWGCMYVPNRGGAFGQHAWTEVFMGDAGWIPIDATVKEPDYVDSGHLRLGHFQSLSIALNPKEMQVLEYRLHFDSTQTKQAGESKYLSYVGKYQGKELLNVIVQSGQLTVDIPDKIMLTLKDPDEDDLWYAKLTDNLYFEFNQDEQNKVTEMVLHEIIPLPKKENLSEEEVRIVPEEWREYVGIYELQQLNAEFKVFYKNGSLTIHNPLEKNNIRLQNPDPQGRFKDQFNKNEIFFEKDHAGKVTKLKIDSINRFRKVG